MRRYRPRRGIAATAAWVVACLASSVALLPSGPAAAQSGPTWPVLVANYAAGTVTDIGPTWSTTIQVGSGPVSAVFTPDGRYAYVADYAAASLSVIADPATPGARVVRTLSVGAGPYEIAFTPDGQYAYVTDYGANTVSIVDNPDSTSPSVSATTLSVGSEPNGIAITPDGKYAYVADYGSNTVRVIDNPDSASPSVSATPITVGTAPTEIAITPDGSYAYVANGSANTVSVIDNADSASPSVGATLAVGAGPDGVAITLDGKYAYVADYSASAVSVIDNADSASPSVSASTLTVAGEPSDVQVSSDGSTVYTANLNTANVSVITNADTASPSVSGTTYTAGSSAWGLGVVPDEAPVARISATPAPAGSPTSFSATASGVEYGSIATYVWSFGDGTFATTSTPATTHVYASLGTYTASVTETDAAGTSSSEVMNGKAIVQAGGSSATASTTVPITTPCPGSGAASCAVSASIAVSGGTLSLLAPGQLFWDDVLSGYDQWETGSATALTGCTSAGNATACSGGTAPNLEVVDATGSAAGWQLSEYLSSSDLPSKSVLDFDGAGASPGDSVVHSVASFPFSGVAPQPVCDAGSSCTPPSVAFSTPQNLAAGTGASSQVNLYWAFPGTGLGAICLGSAAPASAGCGGGAPDAYFDLGLPASASGGTDATTVLTLTVSSGP